MPRKPKKPPTYVQLLAEELGLDKIAVEDKRWRRPIGFLEELDHALRPHIHEGSLPNFGAFLTDVQPELKGWSLITMPESDLELGRKLADGIRSFTLLVGGKFVGVATSDTGGMDEASLVRLIQRDLRNGAIITADARGVVRIVYPAGVAIHQNRRWREKPMVNTVVSRASDFLAHKSMTKFEEILFFAYHALSPRHIGATIVWCLQTPTTDEAAAMIPAVDLTPLGLNVANNAHRSMLRHLLCQTDGATIMAEDGSVTGTGAQLKSSEQSMKYIAASTGTRHTSARRFSFDCASTIVVTVSADGPVTVFSDGVNVIELSFRSADASAKALGNFVPEKRHDIVPSSWTETCSNCGKTSVIEEVVIYGWKDREEAHCPICRAEIASSMCFTISAHVIKRLPSIAVATPAS